MASRCWSRTILAITNPTGLAETVKTGVQYGKTDG